MKLHHTGFSALQSLFSSSAPAHQWGLISSTFEVLQMAMCVHPKFVNSQVWFVQMVEKHWKMNALNKSQPTFI